MTRVLLAGVSMRAAAESAVRAGFDVTMLDAFDDIDTPPAVRRLVVPRRQGAPFRARAAACAAKSVACDAAAYGSGFENHPRAVAELSAGRRLWGNLPDVLPGVRDPRRLADAFRRRGVTVAAVRVRGDVPEGGAWLEKPLRSGGGRGVRPWRAGEPMRRGTCLQEFIGGVPGSLVCVAARGSAVVLGLSRQLIGDTSFGADGFRYCGSILSPSGSALFDHAGDIRASTARLADAVAAECGLVGVNGVDFIARDGVAVPIEVNPRWSASMELVERATGLSVFGAHAGACENGTLPARDAGPGPAAYPSTGASFGKAIVFARHLTVCGDTAAWLDAPDIRDIPAPGSRLDAGAPVCTVFATGADATECHTALVAKANSVYAELQAWRVPYPEPGA